MKNPSIQLSKKVISQKEVPSQLDANGDEKTKDLPQKPKINPNDKPVHPFTVVAIGASAGGLEAITQLLQNLSPTTGMAYIYVQHLSPDHKSMLTPILSKVTSMKVQDIDDMEKIEPNNFYIIPHNKQIEVVDGHKNYCPALKIEFQTFPLTYYFLL